MSVKANILIDRTGNARLADFGLLTIISDPTNVFSSTSYAQGGTARRMGPELINPEQSGLNDNWPTKSSDCYALGMVIYETISGKVPFHKHSQTWPFSRRSWRVSAPLGERGSQGVCGRCWRCVGNTGRVTVRQSKRCFSVYRGFQTCRSCRQS